MPVSACTIYHLYRLRNLLLSQSTECSLLDIRTGVVQELAVLLKLISRNLCIRMSLSLYVYDSKDFGTHYTAV